MRATRTDCPTIPPERLIDARAHPVSDDAYARRCRAALDANGVLVLEGFLTAPALAAAGAEAERLRPLAFYCAQTFNPYLEAPDPSLPADHPRNREMRSGKGCVPHDRIPADSPLRALYDWPDLRRFLAAVLGEAAIHPYADPLSSLNVHYYDPGQELGWHFDNASFAITLLLRAAERGGVFEYAPGVRDSAAGERGYAPVRAILDGAAPVRALAMPPGALVLFRGRDSLHRVTPVEGARGRVLATLSYNTVPGVELSEPARLTFFGRLA